MRLRTLTLVIEHAKALEVSLTILSVAQQKLHKYQVKYDNHHLEDLHIDLNNNLWLYSDSDKCWKHININDISSIVIHEKVII